VAPAIERPNDVPLDERKIRMSQQMSYIFSTTREEIIHTYDAIARREQLLGQVRSQEARAACYHTRLLFCLAVAQRP
jgi:hypothetical protein